MSKELDKLSFDSVRGFIPEQVLRKKINELIDEINLLNKEIEKLKQQIKP